MSLKAAHWEPQAGAVLLFSAQFTTPLTAIEIVPAKPCH